MDEAWAERHIRTMRCVRHWCFVPGCVGSQPLMWVPTACEVANRQIGRGRAFDVPPRADLLQWIRDRFPEIDFKAGPSLAWHNPYARRPRQAGENQYHSEPHGALDHTVDARALRAAAASLMRGIEPEDPETP